MVYPINKNGYPPISKDGMTIDDMKNIETYIIDKPYDDDSDDDSYDYDTETSESISELSANDFDNEKFMCLQCCEFFTININKIEICKPGGQKEIEYDVLIVIINCVHKMILINQQFN